MRTMTRVVAVLAVAAVTLGARPASEPQELASFTPPYAEGSSGGDDYNLLRADEDGRIVVGRAYPVVSVLSCNAYAGWQNFRIDHEATEEFGNVHVELADVAVDPYTFISVNVRDAAGEFIGSSKVRGPIAAPGHSLDVPITWNGEDGFEPQTVEIQFGLELTSACPSADAGTVRFTSLTLQDHAPSPEG